MGIRFHLMLLHPHMAWPLLYPIHVLVLQRITGSLLSSRIKFFGRSLRGNLDLTGDGLPDLTVGSEGQVFVLRWEEMNYCIWYKCFIIREKCFHNLTLRHPPQIASSDLWFYFSFSFLTFRSHPVVSLSVSMRFHPREIPLSSYECSVINRTEQASNITVCFTQELRSARHVGEGPPDFGPFDSTALLHISY